MEFVAIRPKVEITLEACVGCGACDEACPTDVIRLDDRKMPHVVYPEDCQGCFLCEFACPTDAIRVYTSKLLRSQDGYRSSFLLHNQELSAVADKMFGPSSAAKSKGEE
ncbi:MAG: 4Fe-4S binding protein [Nitrososphaerota archaeon]|nr:4Fe-4S binding protein [Nitrososphaerota archaeon]